MFSNLYRSPINSLLVIDEYMTATGDDQGVIKVKQKQKKYRNSSICSKKRKDLGQS
jgi:hypothetical protein